MSSCCLLNARPVRRLIVLAAAVWLFAATCPSVLGQPVNFTTGRTVGGVSINTDGVLDNAQVDHLRKLSRLLLKEDINKAELMQYTVEPYYVPEATSLHQQLIN